jgi:hypothetical protein
MSLPTSNLNSIPCQTTKPGEDDAVVFGRSLSEAVKLQSSVVDGLTVPKYEWLGTFWSSLGLRN